MTRRCSLTVLALLVASPPAANQTIGLSVALLGETTRGLFEAAGVVGEP